MTFRVSNCEIKYFSPTNDVVDNDFCIRIVIYRHTAFLSKFLPDSVDVVNEVDEHCWPIGRTKWHDPIGPLDGIDFLKCKLLLTSKRDGKLMISHRCVKHLAPLTLPKLVMNGQIAPGNGVCNEAGNRVERNVIQAESPHKIINAVDVLLMRLCGKERFE